MPGNLEEFEIIIDWKSQYPIPDWCEEQDYSETLNVKNRSIFEYHYSEIKAFMNYTAYIRAKTGEGWSNISDPQEISTNSAGTL